ncbi:MAG TPA: nitrate- and nitrite sensing domain-containing protein [Streptosporangiaceae bacterium]
MLRRRSIRLRIIVLVLVPVMALIGLYAEVLNLTLGKVLTLRQEAAIRQLVALPVAEVQRQLANERGFALQYLASPGHVHLKVLLGQEKTTDAAVRRFGAAVQTALNSSPAQKEQQAFLLWQGHLKQLGGLRTSVASLGLSKIDAAGAYSAVLEEGDNVLNQAILPVLTGPLGLQATDLLTMAKAAQALGEESDLLRGDLTARSFPPEDLMLVNQLAVLRQELWSQTLPDLDPVLRDKFTTLIPQSAVSQLASLEGTASSGPSGAAQISLQAWTSATSAYRQGFRSALLKDTAALATEATNQAKHLVRNLLVIAGIGLFAILAAVAVGIILGRGLIRQLNDLRQSAVRLSSEQLPAAISRLRSGEEVDVGAEVPRLEPGGDEIGQVSEAFNAAARTAIAAAVDEIKIRQGVNDVFRSLARRNQSLLTRQLQLLDSMERRVHDPEELADLFRVDHMTTRMRRHAEGLLIVAGGSSGRTWREPVPIVDVMRAAAAEVEDYTRIRVTSRTSAALAGHAVADIIHLLAELLENAATFSPASTPVRVDGDRVGRGIVVEIEDRGLGMSERQLAEINSTLSDPPLFDLSGSDQLGLFIAGQLGKRHDVKVTLRSSAYGGVTAVVLIPTELVIDVPELEDDFAIAGIRELGGRPVPQLPGVASDPALTLAATVSTTSSQAHVIDLDTRVVSSEPPDVTDEPAALPAPAAAQEPGVWSAPAAVAADATVAQHLPTREPGTTGLTRGENGLAGGMWPGTPAEQPAARHADVAAEAGAAQADSADLDGLPVRVRQANLAPQLRTASTPMATAADEPAAGPSPEAARNTMAALQRGWQRGRSMTEPTDGEFRTSPSPQRSGDPPDEGEQE